MTCGGCSGVQRRWCCSFSGSAPVCVVGGGVFLCEPARELISGSFRKCVPT